MDDPQVDMEERKTAFVKLILTLAVIDAAVILLVLLLPFVVMGEAAFLGAFPLICVLLVTCMLFSAGYFFYRIRKIDPY